MNASLYAGPLSIRGIPVILSDHLVEAYEDWSEVRSPARARRRLKRGFPQRIRTAYRPRKDVYIVGGKYVMHPETWSAIAAAKEQE